jgi:hypothetical protein
LAIEIGVFQALSVIEITREREGIPDDLLLRTLAVPPFMVRSNFAIIGTRSMPR